MATVWGEEDVGKVGLVVAAQTSFHPASERPSPLLDGGGDALQRRRPGNVEPANLLDVFTGFQAAGVDRAQDGQVAEPTAQDRPAQFLHE